MLKKVKTFNNKTVKGFQIKLKFEKQKHTNQWDIYKNNFFLNLSITNFVPNR